MRLSCLFAVLIGFLSAPGVRAETPVDAFIDALSRVRKLSETAPLAALQLLRRVEQTGKDARSAIRAPFVPVPARLSRSATLPWLPR